MQESTFVAVFEAAAQEVLGHRAVVKRGANLLYQLSLNRQLMPAVSNTVRPARGSSAFQTDICICERMGELDFPRVVIEFKTHTSTHDILTYSAKAGKHKTIYPCLRYGLLASEEESIPGRFFLHNDHLDFFIAAHEFKEEAALKPFAKQLIENELALSRTLERIHFDGEKINYYCTDIIFRDFTAS